MLEATVGSRGEGCSRVRAIFGNFSDHYKHKCTTQRKIMERPSMQILPTPTHKSRNNRSPYNSYCAASENQHVRCPSPSESTLDLPRQNLTTTRIQGEIYNEKMSWWIWKRVVLFPDQKNLILFRKSVPLTITDRD